jgi:hypothetical protein
VLSVSGASVSVAVPVLPAGSSAMAIGLCAPTSG